MQEASSNSSSTVIEHDYCKNLPELLQPKDENERSEVCFFLSHIHDLYKPDDNPYVSPTSVLNFKRMKKAFKNIDEDDPNSMVTWYSVLDFDDWIEHTCGNVATEIAMNVINDVDSHDITMSVLNILQRFSWETKIALIVRTYLLTFGDNGLNLCTRSKLPVEEPSFLGSLLEASDVLSLYETLPKSYMTSKDPKVVTCRINFIVATYWIIKTTMAICESHIMENSGRGDKMATWSTWDTKLSDINRHIFNMRYELKELLVDSLDMEEYKKIQEIMYKEDHSDNMEVLNVFLQGYTEPTTLCYGPMIEKVHVDELKEKHVALFFVNMPIDNESLMQMVSLIQLIRDTKDPVKIVWIPILHQDLRIQEQLKYEKFLEIIWKQYVINYIGKMKKEVIKFIREDWNFKDEPMAVVLDPQGNVVNQNAIHMMQIWGLRAFPFTKLREENLWKEETWRLELLVPYNTVKEPEKVKQWIKEEKYIFLCGGGDIDWMERFTSMVEKLCGVTSKFDAGIIIMPDERKDLRYIEELISHDSDSPNKLVHSAWYFWRRIESMIYSMVNIGKFDDIFQELQRLHHHNNTYDMQWAILAKGSKILVNGHGQVALSTLEEYQTYLKEDNQGGSSFGREFKKYYYQKLYQQNNIRFLRQQRMECPITQAPPTTMLCPDCLCQMKQYTTYLCYHPNKFTREHLHCVSSTSSLNMLDELLDTDYILFRNNNDNILLNCY